MDESIISSQSWIDRTQQLLDSYEHWLGVPLMPRCDPVTAASHVADAPFVLVAHDGGADPLLNYANQSALSLWEMSLSEFLGTPSRLTAEPVHRTERSRLLKKTTDQGFISDYSGIRVSSSGRRFQIHRAVVWNVMDAQGGACGQAATFSEWTLLDSSSSDRQTGS